MDNVTDRIDALFAEWDTDHTPGCLLAVIRDGDLVYQRGYGMADLEQGVSISPESVFYIASTSKQFTAACILLLARQGGLSLDDYIRAFLPEMRAYDAPITVRHLVHHISGLRDSLTLLDLSGVDVDGAVYNNADLVRLVARQKGLNFAPGEQFKYCNAGYLLMAEIVARVSGQTFRDFAHEHIFQPLGMAHTHFDDDHTEPIPNRVVSYRPEGDGFVALPKQFDIVGSGGLLTTVGDLAQWDRNFYDPVVGGADFVELLCTPGTLNSGESLSHAFGLQVGDYKGLRIVHHPGGMLGFRTDLYRFPDQRFSVICLGNCGTISASNLCRRVADLYLADQFELDEYAGDYRSDELDVTYAFEVRDGDLVLAHPAIVTDPLDSQGDGTFRAGGKTVCFIRGNDGRVVGCDVKTDRVFNIRFEKI